MVNNFDVFSGLLNLTNPGDFLFVQILKRRKDNPELSKSEKLIDSFYIYNEKQYFDQMPYMIQAAEANRARVYVRVNKRNDKRVALNMLKDLANLIASEDYGGVRKLYTSSCGQVASEKERKLFLVDYDSKDTDRLKEVMEFISTERIKGKMPEKVHVAFPTRNGYHVLTSPFDVRAFRAAYPDIQIESDASTLLYENIQ